MVAHCGAEAVAITSLSVEAKEFMFTLGLHRISASAKPKFGHFSQIRLRPNFWPNLADANATGVTVQCVQLVT